SGPLEEYIARLSGSTNKRGQLQRNYVWRFIELCNAGLSLDEIKRQAMEPEEAAIDYQI
ncbi:hypothetical protein ACLBPK_14150, partial [Klebsiella pneumoniae]